MNTTLHIPINKSIKQQAESIATEQGYSSLQEVVRVFLASFAQRKVHSAFVQTEAVELLNHAQEAYINNREEETKKAIKHGTAHAARTVKEMMTILEDSNAS